MRQRIATVLIGTTLGEGSDAMVALGVEMARKLGAEVHLAHSLELPRLVPGPCTAHRVLSELAREIDAGLVVVGAAQSRFGFGGFERLLLGSVAEAVVRACTSNVLLVPPATARPGHQPFERRETEDTPLPGVSMLAAVAGAA